MRAILMYHSLDPSGSPISIEPGVFRRQLDWLTSGGVRVVSVDQLLTLSDQSPCVALTFDDGFANFSSQAAPLLLERGLPATLFVVTGHIGRDNRWRGRGDAGVPVLPLLGWEELGRLREEGIILGAHTRTHPRLTGLDGDLLELELANGVNEMQRRLGQRPKGFAYPYGIVDDRVAHATAAHYQWACTTDLRPLGAAESPLRLPRLDAWYLRDPARLPEWSSPAFRVWLWYRRQGRRVRASLARAGGS